MAKIFFIPFFAAEGTDEEQGEAHPHAAPDQRLLGGNDMAVPVEDA